MAIGRGGGRFETDLEPDSDVGLPVLVNVRVGFGWTHCLPEPKSHHRLRITLPGDPQTAGRDPPRE